MRTKQEKPYEHHANSQEYLFALLDYPGYCELISTGNKSYGKLLEWMIDYGKSHLKSQETIPTMKEVAELAHIPYSIIPKQLKAIYDDIHVLNEAEPLKFTGDKQTYFVTFNYLGCWSYFNIGLDQKPAKGEQFNFPFIKPSVGGYSFWVKDITHEIENDRQVITISLTTEYPNHYLHLLKEKAHLYRELDWDEYYGSLKHGTQEKLLKRFNSL